MRGERDRSRTVKAWVGSFLVHGTVLLVAWLTAVVQPRPMEYVTYEIQLVESPDDELVIETPDPTPTPPEPEPEAQPEPEPEIVDEAPPEPEPEPEPEEPEPEPEPQPREPEPEARPRSADVTVSMEGLRRDYPEYYADIQFQVRRCFQARWTRGGDWEATIDFVINADGSIRGRDIDVARSSGNLDFDLRALEAVECAGTKLDPLPSELGVERLPVRFNFSPLGGQAAVRARPNPQEPGRT